MKPRVEITKDMIDKAYSFAYQLETKNNQYARLGQGIDELIETTFIGKLGELVFYKFLTQAGKEVSMGDMLTIYEGQENVDKYDFQTRSGDTVDIKTGYLAKHKRLMVNTSQLHNIPKKYYIGVKLFTKSGSPQSPCTSPKDDWSYGIIEGWASHSELIQAGSSFWGRDFANAIPYDNLKDINEIMELF